MASTAEAAIIVQLLSSMTPDTATGITGKQRGNVEQSDRFTQGIASGNVDRCYKRIRSGRGAGATDNYDLIAAGSLEDLIGQAIDADELKGIVVLCTDGELKVTGAAANQLGCFTAASEGIKLAEGQWVALGLGAGGLDVSTNSKFDITETGGATPADYDLGFIVAQ